MKQLYKPALAVVAVAIAFVLGMSCTGGSDKPEPQQRPGNVTSLPQADDAIDEQLMIALGQAKNFHYKAKVYMSDGKVTEAIASVRQILSLRFPANAPEADDVRNDARALLARLLVSQNQLDEAMRVVEEGLASVSRESFFVANLYTVKGEIHYARANAMDGADPKSIVEKRAAIEALDRSIKINEALQKQLETR
jgi:tetratricopeptide (TPR) repeat protein